MTKRKANILTMILLAVIVFSTVTICLVQQSSAQLFQQQVENAPLPAQCIFCENIDWGKYHAPCILDLTTGRITELEIYERGNACGEIASKQDLNHNIFRLNVYGGFMAIDRTETNQRCIETLKKPTQYNASVASQFCRDCRKLLFSVSSDGLVVLDMYDLEAIKESAKLAQVAGAKRQLEQQTRRMAEIDSIIKRLYEDSITGKLTDERFMKMSGDYEQEQRKLEANAAELRQIVEESEKQTVNIKSFLKIVRSYIEPETLTPDILREFVDKIVIHAPDKSSGHRTQQVDIHYNFVGEIALSYETAKRETA